MADCLTCELTSACKRAARMYSMGMTLDNIAVHLSDVFGEQYYTERNRMFRASKLYPYTPHLILEVENKS